jgi:hypothetical protein
MSAATKEKEKWKPEGPLERSKLVQKLSLHTELPVGLRLNVAPPTLFYPLIMLLDHLYEGFYIWLLLPAVFFLHLLSFFLIYWLPAFKAFINYRSVRARDLADRC